MGREGSRKEIRGSSWPEAELQRLRAPGEDSSARRR